MPNGFTKKAAAPPDMANRLDGFSSRLRLAADDEIVFRVDPRNQPFENNQAVAGQQDRTFM